MNPKPLNKYPSNDFLKGRDAALRVIERTKQKKMNSFAKQYFHLHNEEILHLLDVWGKEQNQFK